MNYKLNDFEKFALSKGISTSKVNDYLKQQNKIISPTIIEERKLNVAAMDVFSALIREKIIYLTGAIDEDTSSVINAQLLYLNSISDSDETVSMFINTPGGSCIDGLAIYDMMNYITPDVATYCMGMAASMGSILISSGTKGKRYCLPNGEIMIHQVSSWAEGQTADMEIRIKHAKKMQNKLYEILVQNTGKSFEQIEKDADRDHWFTAQEALEYGLIDEIIKNKNN